MGFLVVIEPTEAGYSAFVPDLEGCVARGRTRDQVERQVRAVIEFHCAGLRSRGEEPPVPNALATYVEVAAREETG
ncbi:MAG: type II toxin-antitoxin system HicB family antitoxin [Gemmatimonadota bacterium]|nr:type II toxin-antitoxin system HicB family antitoxin [Gemmatimonadota bacterium]